MSPLTSRLSCLLAVLTLAACATRPAPLPVAVAPPPVVMTALPMPAGAHPGMAIPVRLADGDYDTPNHNLSPAATIWHLRAGLNFAALGCRGVQESAIVARYNALVTGQKLVLARAEQALAAEYRANGGAAWRTGYDDAMTRLYNYYALAPARPALCRTALAILSEATTVPPDAFAAFAAARLPLLDASITDFYAAYDAWRNQRPTFQPVIAVTAGTSPRRGVPWIEVDRAIFRMP